MRKGSSDVAVIVTSELPLCYNIRGAITQDAVSPLRRDCDPPIT